MTTTDITTAAASRLAVGTRIRYRRVELAATGPMDKIKAAIKLLKG